MTMQSTYPQSSSNIYSIPNTFSFGFPLSFTPEGKNNKKQPVSAPTSIKRHHVTNSQVRPDSMKQDSTNTTTQGSQVLDNLSEDLRQYELVLDSLVSANLDNNVKEEIKHVDQWFSYLSETERTATIYALLQHSTPVQIRFFITVLQQLGKQDLVNLSPSYPENDTPKMDNSTSHTDIDPIISKTSKNRRSYAFGDISSLYRHSYSPFMDTGTRPFSDPFFDNSTPCLSHIPSLTADGWPYQSTSTGLRTGNQESPLSYEHVEAPRPRSADISPESLGVPPTILPINNNKNNNNENIRHSTSQMTFLTPSERTSWHDLPSPTTRKFSESLFQPLDSNDKNILKTTTTNQINSSLDSIDSLTNKVNHWSFYSPPKQNAGILSGDIHGFGRRSQYSNSNPGLSDLQSSVYHGSSGPTVNKTKGHHTQSDMNRNSNYTYSTKIQRNSSSKTTSHQKERHSFEEVDMNIVQDIPAWLKSVRLHKYTPIFESMSWQQMILLTDDQLLEKKVMALGARRKLLKLFDQIKQHCDKKVKTSILFIYKSNLQIFFFFFGL
ncbi:uncharacterized protein BX664DRAFT_335355 [Halteromyces radiatus]|uniref:uncharacterized protein n=1 Tax=Halteromyces radiatus TaxID=101107 RepID=UPI00221FB14D|nr:uncharacterized protein BX664DRAFT_335355 [Halteromyces radiatus]KAI8086264.1 hypothetical protein BX664DRAFT_335355 [Halteromyces radiatus]